MLIFVQVHDVAPEIHSYAYWAKAFSLVEKVKFANIQPSVYVQQYPVDRFSLTIFYGASKKCAISTVCKCCLHNKQHTHLCRAAAPLQSHSERESEQMQSAVSPSCNVQLFVCPRIYINAILITFLSWLSAHNTHSLGTAAVVFLRFNFLLSFLNYVSHWQAPQRTEMSV